MRCAIDGKPAAPEWVTDRARAYGDGVFETVFCNRLTAPLWPLHLQRLREGCKRLGIRFAAAERLSLFRSLIYLLSTSAPGAGQKAIAGRRVIKIVVARVSSLRGYGYSENSSTEITVALFPFVGIDANLLTEGVDVEVCNYRLSSNPVLAGIKHLNRLDQVMCSAEKAGYVEALTLDQQGFVVEGLKSNVLYSLDGEILYTPVIDQAGIKGVAREYFLQHQRTMGVTIREDRLHCSVLHTCQSLAFINSVHGVLVAKTLAGRKLLKCEKFSMLQKHWQEVVMGASTAGFDASNGR